MIGGQIARTTLSSDVHGTGIIPSCGLPMLSRFRTRGASWDEEDLDDGDEQPDTVVHHDQKVGANDPCPCGSGKKYKKMLP